MLAKHILIGVVVGVLLSSAAIVVAGNLDPPSGAADAASQMYTLEQIYNSLNDGTAATKMTSFTEPASGPGTGTMHTLDDIMALAPATGTYAIGLRIPRTGQTNCWNESGGLISCADTGQDGDSEHGITPAVSPDFYDPYTAPMWLGEPFTDNSDGTVTDNLTGLIWLKNASCFGQIDWTTALTDTSTLNNGDCGLSDGSNEKDWRLPNFNELRSLIDPGRTDPALPAAHPFIGVQSDVYWSSTTNEDFTDRAWIVWLDSGDVSYYIKNLNYYVWPVRGGQ